MDIQHSICSSVDGHLGSFNLLPVMSDAAMNICVQVEMMVFFAALIETF